MRRRRTVARTLAVLVLAFLPAVGSGSAPSAGEKPLFRFAAVADTHLAHARNLAGFRSFMYTIKKLDVDFVLHLGDICGHAPSYLPRMKGIVDLSGLKLHPVSGNHDDNYARNPKWYSEVFGRMYYSFDHKGYHFVMNWSQSQPVEWIRKDLAAVPKGTPIIFCQHYPPRDDSEKTRSGEPWATVLKHANVKLIIAGHRHRHAEGKLGHVRSVVLDRCSFSPWRKRGSYYIGRAYPGGRVELERKGLARLKLLEPPDSPPKVAVTEPASGRILRGAATFRGTAADDKRVRKVQCSVDFGPWRDGRGSTKWSTKLDTTRLKDGHHFFRFRAIDSASQASLALAGVLCMVENRPPTGGNVFRFQQGVAGYDGCADATVRRHADRKNADGSDGDVTDLENWVLRGGEGEFSEFYIRFDLSKAKIPRGAEVKRVTLRLYGNRQNGVKSDEDPTFYVAGVMRREWGSKMTFKTRPPSPGWFVGKDPRPKPDIKGKWPYLGGRQTVYPPKPIDVDLTALKAHVRRWLADPKSNHGLVFSPAFGSKDYNISFQSSRCGVATLRPRLEIEIGK